MKKALVVYDTKFGNTRKVAFALARGMEKQGIAVDRLEIEELKVDKLCDCDFVAIGGPTHMLGTSKRMKEFLQELQTIEIRGKPGFCFDTRVQSRFNHFDINSAAKRIEKGMKRMGFRLIYPRKSALVEARKGPLEKGTEEAFEEIGRIISEKLDRAF